MGSHPELAEVPLHSSLCCRALSRSVVLVWSRQFVYQFVPGLAPGWNVELRGPIAEGGLNGERGPGCSSGGLQWP